MALRKSLRCDLKVSVRWKISEPFSWKGPCDSKKPDIYTVPGIALGTVSLRKGFKSYFSPKPSIRPS
jgi:hypothetical protein